MRPQKLDYGAHLEKCPFCNSGNVGVFNEPGYDNKWVACGACKSEGPIASTADKAAQLWNNRKGEKIKQVADSLFLFSGEVVPLKKSPVGRQAIGLWIDGHAVLADSLDMHFSMAKGERYIISVNKEA